MLRFGSALAACLLTVGCSNEVLTGPAAEDAARQYQASAAVSGPAPYFILDGEEITEAAARALAPESIESIEVVKGHVAVRIHGEKARAGVIQIRTKAKKSPPDR